MMNFAETRTVAELIEAGEIVDKSRVCLLDMRGEKELSPADADAFDYVLLYVHPTFLL